MRNLYYATVKFIDGSEDYASFYHEGSLAEATTLVLHELSYATMLKIGHLIVNSSQVRSIRIKEN